MADDEHKRQRKDWAAAIAGRKRQQRRDRWKRAPASPGAGMARVMPPEAREEEETVTGDDSIASD